jgi:hypothetical protein
MWPEPSEGQKAFPLRDLVACPCRKSIVVLGGKASGSVDGRRLKLLTLESRRGKPAML